MGEQTKKKKHVICEEAAEPPIVEKAKKKMRHAREAIMEEVEELVVPKKNKKKQQLCELAAEQITGKQKKTAQDVFEPEAKDDVDVPPKPLKTKRRIAVAGGFAPETVQTKS